MKLFILKIVKYVTAIILMANVLGWTGDLILRKSSFFKPSFLLNNYKQGEQFDYFILGSSRGLTTLDSKQIDSSLSTKGINLSMDDTDLKTHLLMLNHFFKNGYKSKYCVLVLDNLTSSGVKLGDNDYKFASFINEEYVKNHFKTYESTRLKPLFNSLYWPFLKYSYYNIQIIPPVLLSILNPKKRHRFDVNGNYTYPNIKNKSHKNKRIKIDTSRISNPLVNEFRKLCEINKTELIIYIAPYENLKIILDQEENIFNNSAVINDENLFYDAIHVNKEGRKAATNEFIKLFKHKLLQQYYN
jgi:hypothetical protein